MTDREPSRNAPPPVSPLASSTQAVAGSRRFTAAVITAAAVGVAALAGFGLLWSAEGPAALPQILLGMGLLFLSALPWSLLGLVLPYQGAMIVVFVGAAVNVVGLLTWAVLARRRSPSEH